MRIDEQMLRELERRGRVKPSEVARVLGRPIASEAKPSKYRNVKTTVDGIVFDSKREASRYMELVTAQKGGRIRDLRRQYVFPIVINGVRVCDYLADFRYDEFIDGEWNTVTEDVKGMKTDVYVMKRKLMLAVHGIEIRETF